MSILLTHGYFLNEDKVEQNIMMPYPPLGMLYISAYLEQYQIAHEVFDTTFSTEEKWMTFVRDKKPRVIAFYVNLLTKIKILHLIDQIKSNEQLKHIKIVLGGPDVTYNDEDYLKNDADFLIVGEGEETFLDFAKHFYSDGNYSNVAGLRYKATNGQIQRNEARTHIQDIDQLPFPNWKKIDAKKYLSVWKKHHDKSTLNISTQRGCPYSCRWCSKAVYGQSYRRRSPKLVVDEIEFLMKNYQPDALWFVDDVFTINRKWVDDFAQEMGSRKISIPYECITRTEHLDEDILKKLKSTGCTRIWIGAESGSQRILDLMDRKVKIEHVKEMILLCKKHGIQTGTFIMIGYPTETEQDILASISYLKQANPDLFTVTISYPIKGTSLYDQVKNKIIYLPEWKTGTDRQIDFKRTYPRKYYDYALRRMIHEVSHHKEKSKGKGLSKKALMHWLKAKISAIQMKWAK